MKEEAEVTRANKDIRAAFFEEEKDEKACFYENVSLVVVTISTFGIRVYKVTSRSIRLYFLGSWLTIRASAFYRGVGELVPSRKRSQLEGNIDDIVLL